MPIAVGETTSHSGDSRAYRLEVNVGPEPDQLRYPTEVIALPPNEPYHGETGRAGRGVAGEWLVLRLQTLGELRLHGGDVAVLSSRRKELVLLTYLARRRPRPLSRAQAAALLWPERNEARARQSLRQALLELRRLVGKGLALDTEQIVLDEGALELDANLFEREAKHGRLEVAVSRWGGDFLPGADEVGGEELRAWLEAERESLRRRLRSALSELVEDAHRRSAWGDGIQWAERWTTALPWDLQGHYRLLQLRYLDGQSAEALALHSALAARLRALKMELSPELEQLGRLLEKAAATAPRAPSIPAALLSPDLVGRGPALAEVDTAWRSAVHGRGGIVVVEGELGIGKTRLCEEFLRRVGQHAGAYAECRVQTRGGAGTTELGVLARLATGLAAAPGIAGASGHSLAALAALAPAMRTRFPLAEEAGRDPATLSDALRDSVEAVADEQPLLIFIDDLPQSDAPSRRVLDTLFERLPPHCLVIVTARTGEDEAPLGFPPHADVRRLKLRPLALADVELLVGSIVELEAEERHRLAARLQEQCAGNPFYVVELISAMADDGTLAPSDRGTWRLAAGGGPLPLPTSLRDVIARRVDRLTPQGRAALEAAAVLGVPFDRELLAEVAGASPVAIESGLDELIVHRLVRTREPGCYEFAHELVRRHVDRTVPVARAEELSSRASAALEHRPDGDHAMSAALAHHRTRAAAVTMAAGRARRRRVAGVAFVCLAGFAAVIIPRVRATAPTDPASIAVLPFSVSGSGELEYLQDGMATLLSTGLNGVGAFRSVDPRAVIGMASQLDGRLPEVERGRRVAERVGAGTYVVGNLVQGEGRVRITATAYQRSDPVSPVARAAVDGPTSQLFELVDAIVGRLLTGLSPGPYGQLTRTAATTTGSLPALKAFLEGERLFRGGNFHPAARAFQRAVTEDTTFALAYYWLSVASWWADDAEAIDSAAALAVRYGGRLSERDRRLFQAWDAYIRGDALESERVYRQIVALEPENVEGWLQLGEVLFHSGPRRGGLIGAARVPFQRVLVFEPEHTSALLHLVRIAAAEQRLAELDSLTGRILALRPSGEWGLEARALRSYASKDRAEQLRVIADLRTAPEGRIWSTGRYVAVATHELEGARELVALLTEGTRPREVRAFGHLALAHAHVARGRLGAASDELGLAAVLDPRPALEHRALLALLPFVPASRERLVALRDMLTRETAPRRAASLETSSHLATLHDGVRPELRAYLIAALSLRLGDTATARVHLADLERPRPTPHATTVARDAAGSIRAQLAHRSGRTAEALREMEEVHRLEARVGLIGGSPFYSQELERYLYAEMLEGAGRLEESLQWYGSFSGNAIFDFAFLPPSHAARGRIYERLGRRRAAAREYGRARELLREADSEMGPLMRELEQALRRVRE